jgi:pimeloyl-ACP methyl ester carboxylesterase
MFYQTGVRTDLWPPRKMAEQYFRQVWKALDPRVVELWMKYGLRDTPTALYPEPGKVTLSTTKAQEAWLYSRICLDPLPAKDGQIPPPMRVKYADINETIFDYHPFYRAEDVNLWEDLPHIRPGVIYLFPTKGPMSSRDIHLKVDRTGIGFGGSGGVAEGRVESTIINGTGHLLPFEKPQLCAQVTAEWLGRDLHAWRERIAYAKEYKDNKSIDMLKLSDEWVQQAKLHCEKTKKRRGQTKL